MKFYSENYKGKHLCFFVISASLRKSTEKLQKSKCIHQNIRVAESQRTTWLLQQPEGNIIFPTMTRMLGNNWKKSESIIYFTYMNFLSLPRNDSLNLKNLHQLQMTRERGVKRKSMEEDISFLCSQEIFPFLRIYDMATGKLLKHHRNQHRLEGMLDLGYSGQMSPCC